MQHDKRLMLRLSNELKESIQNAAIEKGVSSNELIRLAVDELLKEEKQSSSKKATVQDRLKRYTQITSGTEISLDIIARPLQ